MAEFERNWFRRLLIGEDVPSIYATQVDADGRDGEFELSDDISFDPALHDVGTGDRLCSNQLLGSGSGADKPVCWREVTLRWIYTHMIAEYARHSGHADSSVNASTA